MQPLKLQLPWQQYYLYHNEYISKDSKYNVRKSREISAYYCNAFQSYLPKYTWLGADYPNPRGAG